MPITDHKPKKNAFPITIVCDNIRDPGNLGTLLRTATAVGALQIIVMKGKYSLLNYYVIFIIFCIFQTCLYF